MLFFAFSLFVVLPLTAGAIALAPPTAVPDRFSFNRRPYVTAATNGTQFIVAWEEDQWAVHAPEPPPVSFRTYLDSCAPQQALPLGALGRRTPAVAWTGGDWLIVSGWGPDQQTVYVPQGGPSLFGVAVHESGEVAGPEVTLASGPNAWGSASVAWNGSVALASSGGTSAITAADGRVLHPLSASYQVLASAGGNFLVQELTTHRPGYAIVDGDGALVREGELACSGSGPVTCDSGGLLAGTAHGDEFALVFRGVFGLTLVLLDSAGNFKSMADYAADLPHIGQVSVAWSGGSYVIALIQTYPGNGFCLVRADGHGTTQCMASSYAVNSVALAASDATLLVVWSEVHQYPNPGNPLYSDRVMTAFSASNELPVEGTATEASTVLLPQYAEAIEADPRGDTVVWVEPDDFATNRVMVGGIDRDGTTRVPRVLATGAFGNVRLARGATSTMAVWAGYAREINDDGSFGPLLAVGSRANPAIAFDGQDWLVVWQDGQIMTALLRAHQTTPPIVRTLAPTGQQQVSPVVASRGSDFLVAWLERVPGAEYEYDGAFVDRDGMTTTPPMLLATPTTTAFVLDIAASGSRYLLVIDDLFTPGSPIPDVLVRRVGTDTQPRVRPHAGGGFATLFSTIDATHFMTLDALGEVTFDTTLPYGTDFLEENGSVKVVYSPDYGLGGVYLDTFTTRRRAAR